MEQGRMYKKYLSNLPPFQEAAVLEYAMDFRGELTRFSLRLERGNLGGCGRGAAEPAANGTSAAAQCASTAMEGRKTG